MTLAGATSRLRQRQYNRNPGQTLSVVESEVFNESGDDSRLIAKATVTLAALPRPTDPGAGDR